jgi:hypothetical protein
MTWTQDMIKRSKMYLHKSFVCATVTLTSPLQRGHQSLAATHARALKRRAADKCLAREKQCLEEGAGQVDTPTTRLDPPALPHLMVNKTRSQPDNVVGWAATRPDVQKRYCSQNLNVKETTTFTHTKDVLADRSCGCNRGRSDTLAGWRCSM